MVVFRAVKVGGSPLLNETRWAVKRSEPGFQIVVSRFYAREGEAVEQAETLNQQAAARTMG